MADHSLFIFVRVHGATPESVGNTLRDSIGEIMDIYSTMGEWDLLVRIEHPDLNTIQKVVTEKIRSNPNVAQTYTILGYQLYGSKWPGFDFPDEE
ncbi:MAG: Lrp/AsnC ligand binding domain-containing protein [Hyphomonadaceae bacterium]|nr:Lrp/AsnC ligand binding domain-containing protein [Hyphomonadaceae bacterium]